MNTRELLLNVLCRTIVNIQSFTCRIDIIRKSLSVLLTHLKYLNSLYIYMNGESFDKEDLIA